MIFGAGAGVRFGRRPGDPAVASKLAAGAAARAVHCIPLRPVSFFQTGSSHCLDHTTEAALNSLGCDALNSGPEVLHSNRIDNDTGRGLRVSGGFLKNIKY